MQIEQVRVSSSPHCELNCSYCETTSSRSHKLTKTIPLIAKKHIFACNTLYRDDLENILANSNGNLIEAHFTTLTSPRQNTFSKHLHTHKPSMIVIIDHLDRQKFLALKEWDRFIQEYRVVPSRLYPSDLFLRELPHFIQNKIHWSFPNEHTSSDPLLGPDEVHWTVSQLETSPLTSNNLSDSMWRKTWDSSLHVHKDEKKYITIFVHRGEELSLPHLNVRQLPKPSLPSLSIELSLAQSLYVGSFNSINEDILEQIQSRDFDLLYCRPESIVQVPVIEEDSAIKAMPIRLLENFLVRKDLWVDYINSTSCIGEMSWNTFIENQEIIIKEVSIKEVKTERDRQLHEEIQNFYYASPNNNTYNSLFLNFGYNQWSRHGFFYIFHLLYTLIALIPEKYHSKVLRATRNTSIATRTAAGQVNDELKDTGRTFKKSFSNFKHGLFRLYWGSYHQISEGYGKIIKKYIFHLLIRKYIFGKIFTEFLYGKVWCGTVGFIRSLNDFPQSYEALNGWSRLWAKLSFVAKKFGWLALKTVGLK